MLRDRAPIRFLTRRTDNLGTGLEATNGYRQKGENRRNNNNIMDWPQHVNGPDFVRTVGFDVGVCIS